MILSPAFFFRAAKLLQAEFGAFLTVEPARILRTWQHPALIELACHRLCLLGLDEAGA